MSEKFNDHPTRSASEKLHAKPVIGLTGGIGAGKSAVAAGFRQLGCAVIDSDKLAHNAINAPECVGQLRNWWGDAVLAANGTVNRAAVGRIVFADQAELHRLNELLHPMVLKNRLILLNNYFSQPDIVAIVLDSPLLGETGLDRECDAVVYVHASKSTRLRRVMAARSWDGAQLAARELNQWSLDKKRKIAQYIINNDDDQADIIVQIRQTLSRILAGFKQ